ncbi:MAG: SGNH/GDSL hydrolase family protein [Pirellulales bacterium]|nr:SGNH/GDSL hydrolase family protein [Pirellulales bacterium]
MSPEFDVVFRTNSQGLRDDEIGPKRGYRILLLGDSYTCGYGVERPRLFADLLEKELHAEVVNAGVGGFEIIHQLHYFRTRAREFHPDLVIYALYLNNDLTGNRSWESSTDGSLRRRDGKPILKTKGTAKLICLVKSFVPARKAAHALRRRIGRQPPALPGERYLALCTSPLGKEAREDYRTSLELLRQLRDEVQSSGAEFLVVSFPLRAVVEDRRPECYRPPDSPADACYDLLRPVARFSEMIESAGIAHIGLTESLRAARQRLAAPLYFLADGHLNAAGHRCLADALASELASRQAPNGFRHLARTTESH